jgi:hypothetical protein
MSDPRRIDVCSTVDVACGTALKVETAGLILAVFNLEGEFFVTRKASSTAR